MISSIELVKKAVKVLDSKKAQDIVVLDVRELTSLGDYFVIASGGNTTLVKTLSEELEARLGQEGVNAKRTEGAGSAMWILMDYTDVMIHIFYNETREFYCLERLWADAPKVDLQSLLD